MNTVTEDSKPWMKIKEVLVTAPKNNLKENKPDPTLLPMDVLIEFLVPAYEEGLKKYYRESWRQGFKTSDMIAAAKRHINKFFYELEDYDPDAKELDIDKHHLAGAVFSLLCVMHSGKHYPELDDRRCNITGKLLIEEE